MISERSPKRNVDRGLVTPEQVADLGDDIERSLGSIPIDTPLLQSREIGDVTLPETFPLPGF